MADRAKEKDDELGYKWEREEDALSMRISEVDELPLAYLNLSRLVGFFGQRQGILSPGLAMSAIRRAQAQPKRANNSIAVSSNHLTLKRVS
jgi:hypothetical protein